MMQVVPNSFKTLLLLKELVLSATTQLSTNMYNLKYILSYSFELDLEGLSDVRRTTTSSARTSTCPTERTASPCPILSGTLVTPGVEY